MSEKQPRYMTDCEKRLARLWHNEDKTPVEEIAHRLRRNKSSIWDLFGEEEGVVRGVGRKPALDEGDKDRLVELTESMVGQTIQQLYNNYTTTIQQPIQQLYNNYVSLRFCAFHA